MKHQKLKGYMALLLLCLATTMLFNCQREDEASTAPQDNFKTLDKHLQITRLYETDINKNRQLLRGIDVVEKKMKERTTNRDIYNATYDFTINTTYAKAIDDGTTRTYTFGVYRDEDNGLLENLFMVEREDGTFDVSLVQYDLTPLEIEALNNREIVDVEGKIAFVALDDISGDVLGKYYYNGNCYENYWVYNSGNSCASGNHEYSDGNACDYWGDVNQMATSGGYVLTPTIVSCSNGGGGDNTNNPNGNPNGNPNDGTGSGPFNPSGSTSVITCTQNCIEDVDEGGCPPIDADALNELEAVFGVGNIVPLCDVPDDEVMVFNSIQDIDDHFEDLITNVTSEGSVEEIGEERRDTRIFRLTEEPELFLKIRTRYMMPTFPEECMVVQRVDSNLLGNTTFHFWTPDDEPNDPYVTYNHQLNRVRIEVEGNLRLGAKTSLIENKVGVVEQLSIVMYYDLTTGEYIDGEITRDTND